MNAANDPPALIYAPNTPAQARRVVRGDLGPVTTARRNPRNSAHAVLRQVYDAAHNYRPCNPDAAADVPGLPAAVAAAPPAEQCRLAIEHVLATKSAAVQRADGRFVQLPKPGPGATSPMITGDFAAWPADASRPYWAKKALDRARQMSMTARTILRKTIAAYGDQAFTRNAFLKAQALVWSTQPGEPQRPRHNKQSALHLLYVAYRLVREYEMNPLPPFEAAADGGAPQPNPRRAREDADYVLLMGCVRLQPNRLGTGPAHDALMDVGGAALTGHTRPVNLYASIAEADARDGRPEDNPRDDVTDMARCLRDVHANFPPPVMAVPDPPADGTMQVARVLPWADLGNPYPPGTSPFAGLGANYVPVFFPSGESRSVPARPPYAQRAPEPLAGTPDPLRTKFWDARFSLGFLASEKSRLKAIATGVAFEERAKDERDRRLADPGAPLALADSDLPVRLWPGGPKVVASTRDLPQAAADAGAALVPPLMRAAVGPPAMTRIDPALSLSRRPRRNPGTTLVRADVNAERARVPTGSTYPLGAPAAEVPVAVDPAGLPDQVRRQAMLQHALFQMDAPRTQWQAQRIPEELLPAPPLNMPLARFGTPMPSEGLRRRKLDGSVDAGHRGWAAYASAFPPGVPAPAVFTMAQRANPPGRALRNRPPEPRPLLAQGRVPIGPLLVDPRFASQPDRVASAAYAMQVERDYRSMQPGDPDRPQFLWFTRTNQTTVDGANTWGLDFLFPPYTS